MTLLDAVGAHLDARGVAHALIGASALAVHGVSRSTFDQDLLVTDTRVLDPVFWSSLDIDASVDARRGDADDPLAGVVRLGGAGDRDVDIVVGRHAWQQEMLERAAPVAPGAALRAVQAADLILLKLYAGGSQDRWDIEQLLAMNDAVALAAIVDDRLSALPARCSELWQRLRNAP